MGSVSEIREVHGKPVGNLCKMTSKAAKRAGVDMWARSVRYVNMTHRSNKCYALHAHLDVCACAGEGQLVGEIQTISRCIHAAMLSTKWEEASYNRYGSFMQRTQRWRLPRVIAICDTAMRQTLCRYMLLRCGHACDVCSMLMVAAAITSLRN